MRLEITVDGGKPFYFPIAKDVIILGSSSSADIKIPQMHVSRKHVAIHLVGDKFFVEDQGSTNGSFINDEKLEPLQKREFTSFFPVRIGSVVFVALVPDEDDSVADDAAPFEKSLAAMAEKTESANAARPARASAEGAGKADATRTIAIGKRVPPSMRKESKKDKSALMIQLAVLVLGIAGAGYYVYSQKVEEAAAAQAQAEAEAVIVKEAEKKAAPKPQPKPSETITDDDFISRAEMETILARVKCVTETEKALCNSIEGANKESWGATEVDEQLVVVVDGTPFYEQAKKYMPVPEEIKNGTAAVAMLEAHEDNIWKLAASLFIKLSLSKMPYATLKEDLLVFGLFHKKESGTRFAAEIVGHADQLQNVSLLTGTKMLNDVAATGPAVLTILDRYYRFKGSELQ